ncbi:MAG: hypothetical protein AAGI38_15385 [Bacteroidota bacterium]
MDSKISLVIVALLLMGCPNGIENQHTTCPKIERLESYDYQTLNKLANEVDTNLNPFANSPEYRKDVCVESKVADHIQCIIQQFATASFPLHFGPEPEVNLHPEFVLEDSIFIEYAMNDSTYFEEDERQYAYYLGINIPNKFGFWVVVIQEVYSVGRSYHLFSISPSGQFIDRLLLGSEASDVESVFGKIESLQDIEVITKSFGYDESKEVLFFDSSQTKKYFLNGKGKFIAK